MSCQGDGKKNANSRKWRKTNGGWVGKKSSQFPSRLAFILSIEKQEKQKKQNKAKYAVKSYILILDVQKVVKINQQLEINHS